jgi:hypothetical protein
VPVGAAFPDPGTSRLVDPREQRGLQKRDTARLGERPGTQAAAVDRSIGTEDSAAEPLSDNLPNIVLSVEPVDDIIA